MIGTDEPALVIVVPDGLAACPRTGAPLPQPSFAYRAVLDHVAAWHASARILLAPANRFGGSCTEQAAASGYLRDKGVLAAEAPDSGDSGYIDTRGNARALRHYLTSCGDWPLPPAVLAVAKLHAHRAAVCFRREGFRLLAIEAIPYTVPTDEAIVSRLWYYRYPAMHRMYEAMALLRDLARPAARLPEDNQ